MKLSFNWLGDFLDLKSYSPEEVSRSLTMKTCEVERIEPIFDFPRNLIVGEITHVEPHPNADRLRICRVSAGKNEVTIVTGANNTEVGKKYPLAGENTILTNGVTIKRSKLRGIDSEGMLCSAEEIGMQDFIFSHLDEMGDLLKLPNESTPGVPLSEIFPIQDWILDIDNKSITHRPDLWGHFGFARELSAILNIPLKIAADTPTRTQFAQGELGERAAGGEPDIDIEIKNDSALAYSGAVFGRVKVKPSDIRTQARLIATGMRPINNVVDTSNYVMLELGQPNHAFDRGKISGKIKISPAQEGEELVTLDSETRKLPQGVILIRDQQKPIAIGGIIGGESSEVSESTNTIFLESAAFHRRHIRSAISSLSLRTEASQRFEKGLDPSLTEISIIRFAELLKVSSPDLEMTPIKTERTEEIRRNRIDTTFSYIQSRLGEIDIPTQEIIRILESLEMKCQQNGDRLTLEVPSYRSYHDIEIPEDIIEEIIRVAGYDQIKPKPLLLSCEVPSHPNPIRELEHQLRSLFSDSYHFTEVYNYCFHSSQEIQTDTRYASQNVELQNSIQQDQKYLRISPLPSLLKNAAENHKRHSDLRLYEIEKIFLPDEKDLNSLPTEKIFIAGILLSPEKDIKTLRFLASILSDSLERLSLPRHQQKYNFLKEDKGIFHPGRGGAIIFAGETPENDKIIYKWGELHPKLTREYHINKRVFYFEAFLDDIISVSDDVSHYRQISKFPSAVFELTILADQMTPFQKIIDISRKSSMDKEAAPKKISEDIEYLGAFSGESIPSGKKAVSMRFTWTNPTRTIEHEELKSLQDSLVESLSQAGFPLR